MGEPVTCVNRIKGGVDTCVTCKEASGVGKLL